jgi:hypothetical protein
MSETQTDRQLKVLGNNMVRLTTPTDQTIYKVYIQRKLMKFRWRKPNGVTYTVSLNEVDGDACNCTGFHQRRKCKHVDASKHLIKIGFIEGARS